MKKSATIFIVLILVCILLFVSACDLSVDDIGNASQKLPVPTGLYVADNILHWNSVEYATMGYKVKIAELNNREMDTSTNSLSLSFLPTGIYTLSIKALGDGTIWASSDYSDSISYTRNSDSGQKYEDDVVGAFGSFDEVNTRESYLGYGVDIINASAITSKNVKMSYPIFDTNMLLQERLLKSNEHYNTFESIESESIEEFVKSMSNSSSITSGSSVYAKGDISGTSVSASASLTKGLSTCFKKTTDTVEKQYFLEIIAENQSYWLILQSSESRYKEMLSAEFKADLYNKSITPAQLFDKYGTHLLTSVAMGGNICMYYTFYSYDKSTTTEQMASISRELKANIEVAYGGNSAGASQENGFENTFTYLTKAHEYNVNIDEKIISAGGGSYGINNKETLYTNYFDWQKSLDTYPVVIGIKDTNSLYPIWELIDKNVSGASERYKELMTYFTTYGTQSYNDLCESYGITPPIAPTSIKNLRVGDAEFINDSQPIHIKAGDVKTVTFDVLPENAVKYSKTYTLDAETVSKGYATINESGVLVVDDNVPANTYITLTVNAGSVSKKIQLYVKQAYNVQFNTRVSNINISPYVGIEGGMSIEQPSIYREGYLLLGWTMDIEGTLFYNFDTDYVTNNMTLYAKWQAIKPIVTFDSQGGSQVDSQIIAYKTSVAKPASPTRNGYVFRGWYSDVEGTEEYDFSTQLTENTTLYACWNKIVYTVKFETNGGTHLAETTTDISKNYKINEPNIKRTYYELVGWYKDSSLTKQFNFNTEITENITLYAKWTPINVTVKLIDSMGGILQDKYGNEIKNAYANVDNNFVVGEVNIPYLEGYSFVGWYYNSKKIVFENYSFAPQNDNYEFSVYAEWEIKSFNVTYIVDDISEIKTFKYGSLIPLKNPEKEGYTFNGWQCDLGEIPTTMPAQDIEMYGNFVVNNYTVTYKVDGSVYAVRNYKYGEAITYILESSVKSDNETDVFSGWIYEDGVLPTTMPAKNIVISGVFNSKLSTVKYYVDEQLIESKNVIADTCIPQPTMKKEGYTFSGWRMLSGNEYIEVPEMMPHKDLELYGTFEINTYSVVIQYVFDNGVSYRDISVTAKYGENYSVTSDSIEGYTPSSENVTGVIPANDDTVVKVIYNRNTYQLTIKYKYENASQSFDEQVLNYRYNDNYCVASQTINGYTPDKSIVSGIMPAENIIVFVNYAVKKHSIIVKYEFADGTKAAEDYLTEKEYNSSYLIVTPVIKGYIADKTDISGLMDDCDVVEKVVYSAKMSTVTLNTNNVTIKTIPQIETESLDIYFNTKRTFPIPRASYYKFAGWFAKIDNNEVQVTNGSGKLCGSQLFVQNDSWAYDEETVTLYAKWEQYYIDEEGNVYSNYTYIKTENDLYDIANNMAGEYLLISDIEVTNTNWSPIGGNNHFMGTLNGDGFTITGITTTKTFFAAEYYGLFSTINNAQIRNLNIDVYFYHSNQNDRLNQDDGRIYIGGIAGAARGNSVIEKCNVSGNITQLYITKSAYLIIGGLFGRVTDEVQIIECNNSAKVYGQALYVRTGGIAGRVDNTKVLIQDCYNSGYIRAGGKGDLIGGGSGYSGGIVGLIVYKNQENIINCDNGGEILSSGRYNSHGDRYGSRSNDVTAQEFIGQ